MGVVMWEMWTLQVPFQELSAQQILVGSAFWTTRLSASWPWSPLLLQSQPEDGVTMEIRLTNTGLQHFIGLCAGGTNAGHPPPSHLKPLRATVEPPHQGVHGARPQPAALVQAAGLTHWHNPEAPGILAGGRAG
jgi:hypothetical protein